MPKVTLFHDTRRPLKDGTYPVRLRLYHRQYTHYHLNYNFTEADFKTILEMKEPRRLNAAAKELRNTFKKAEGLCGSIIPFTVDAFEKLMFEKPVIINQTVGQIFEGLYSQYINQGRIKTAKNYRQAWNSLSTFFGEDVRFEEIDTNRLHEYESWMLNNGKSYSTIGMYLRFLRMLFNEAKEKGLNINYPFGKRRYQIPSGANVKKALPLADLQKIANFEPTLDRVRRMRDYWLFCYLANGMNFKDMARLKKIDIHGKEIVFTRNKTRRSTRSNPKLIRVPMHPKMQAIIDRWKGEGVYVFPVLEKGMTEEEIEQRVTDVMRMLRRSIAGIAKKLGIEENVNLMSARHSFAQRMKEGGAPTSAIRDALGHTSETTTQNYLDSFGLEDRAKWSEGLL